MTAASPVVVESEAWDKVLSLEEMWKEELDIPESANSEVSVLSPTMEEWLEVGPALEISPEGAADSVGDSKWLPTWQEHSPADGEGYMRGSDEEGK